MTVETRQRAKKMIYYPLLAIVVAGSCLWMTTWALVPTPAGEAVAPSPQEHPEAVIQVYGADVWGWRGKFAIHTWVSIKPKGASSYRTFEVIGWRLRRNRSVVSVSSEVNPAQGWFGSPAILLHDVRGAPAEALIAKVEAAVEAYPYSSEYKMWPGPNSNSFVAWIGLQVPELGLSLPTKALGQSWMKDTYPALVASEF